jgi:predicted MFS family arabinose efflux permease
LLVRQLVHYLGERGLAMSGGILLAIGLIAIIVVPLVLVPIGMFIMGLGLYLLHSTLQTNATQMAPEARGLGVSTFANSLFLGQAAGVFAGGLVVDHVGFATAYGIGAVALLFLGIGFARLLPSRPHAG